MQRISRLAAQGAWGALAAFVLDSDIPAFLRKGALEALGGQPGFERDILTIRNRGANAPLSMNEIGHYVLIAVEFGKVPPCSDRGPNSAASYVDWSFLEKRPDFSDGGLHLHLVGRGLLRFVPPKEFPACAAANLGDARDNCISGTKKIFMKLHANWGHVSAGKLERVLADLEGGNFHLVHFADEVLGHCDVCKASDKAPHFPIAGASTVSGRSHRTACYGYIFQVFIASSRPAQ